MEVYEIFPSCKSGAGFEDTVTNFLQSLGFNANRNGKDDGGIDIVAKKRIQETEYTFYIQCKYFNTILGKHPIQEVYAGANYYGGNGRPVVITNNRVTADARVYAKRLGVEIIADPEWTELRQVFQAKKVINPNVHHGLMGIIVGAGGRNPDYVMQAVKEVAPAPTDREQLKLEIISNFDKNEEIPTACPHCGSIDIKKHGRKSDRQRYYCKDCHKTFVETSRSLQYHSRLTPAQWRGLLLGMVQNLSLLYWL